MRSLALIACIALCACSGIALAQSETPVASGATASAAEAAPATIDAQPEAATVAAKPVAASEATQSDPATDAAEPVAASDAAQPVAAANATQPVEESASAGEAPKKYEPPRGYKAEIRVSDGEKVYCRSEDVIGTRFVKKVCYSEIELEQVRARNESEANDVTRRSRVCGTATACASN